MRQRLCIQPLACELAHRRVDDRDAGAPLAPGGKRRRIVVPGNAVVLSLKAATAHMRKVV